MTTSTLLKKGWLIVSTLFLPLALCATTPHTISIDGTNDFATDEDVTGNNGATWYFTWDANNFYFGLDATDVGSGSATRFLHLYLDTDPQTDIATGAGATLGVIYNTQEPTFPFTANYHFRWRADNGFTNVMNFESGTWNDSGFTIGAGQDMEVFQSGTFIEVRISRTALDNPAGVYTSGSMINEQGGAESTFFMTPSGVNTDGYDADYSGYFAFPLINGISPDDASLINTPLPVEWLSLEASQMAPGAVSLEWATARESENKGFTPQMMAPGSTQFTDLGWVAPGLHPDQTQHYAWELAGLSTGTYTFRIRQTDIDGLVSYSPLVNFIVAPWHQVQVLKEGATLQVNLQLDQEAPVDIQVFDLSGRTLIRQQTETLARGSHQLSLQPEFSAGILIYRIQIAGEPFAGRIRW